MQKDDLYRWITNPEKLDESSLQELKATVSGHPYFHTARLLYTKNLYLTNSAQFEKELGKTAVFCNDRRQLFYHIFHDEFSHFLRQFEETETESKDRTEELLDSFLSSLKVEETAEMPTENVELNLASTDYFLYLKSLGDKDPQTEQEINQQQKLRHQDIIDAFIEKASTENLFIPDNHYAGDAETQPVPVEKPAEEREGGEFLTETLARIYIKQKKYQQALTIIKRLSLNFPKKSVYFAHQIRFLELLIMNEQKLQDKGKS